MISQLFFELPEPEIKLPQTLESDDDLFNLVLTREDMKSPDRHPKNAFFRLDLSPPAQDFNLFNPGTKNASTQTGIIFRKVQT